MAEEEQVPRSGMTRRDIMKRGAVVGGAMVWAVPVVTSFTSPAGAATTGSPEPENPEEPGGDTRAISNVILVLMCDQNRYVVKYEDGAFETVYPTGSGNDVPGDHCYAGAKTSTDLPEFDDSKFTVVGGAGGSINFAVQGCTISSLISKCADDLCKAGTVTGPNTATAVVCSTSDAV